MDREKLKEAFDAGRNYEADLNKYSGKPIHRSTESFTKWYNKQVKKSDLAADRVANKELTPREAEMQLLGLFSVSNCPEWLTPIDLYIGMQFYKESKLKGIAYIEKLAYGKVEMPLKWSREFLLGCF